MDINKAIERYSYLLAQVERNAARGATPPPAVTDEMNRIYSRAAAMLSPAEQQQALAAVDVMKAQYHQQFDVHDAQEETRAQMFAMNSLSKKLTNMDMQQYSAALRGEKVPVKGAGARALKNPMDKLEHYLRNNVRSDMTKEKFLKVADRAQDMVDHGKDPSDYIREQFKGAGDPEEAVRMTQGWLGSGVELTMELMRRRGAEDDKDHYVTPDDATVRRTQLVDAALKDGNIVDDRISKSYLENEGMQGDIARAWLQHENEQEAEEYANFDPAAEFDYNVDQDEEPDYVHSFGT